MEVSQSITVNGSVVHNELLDDHSELEPPDPIPNSEVKRLSADGSVGFPHVRVGHRQALKSTTPLQLAVGAFFMDKIDFRTRDFISPNIGFESNNYILYMHVSLSIFLQ